MSTPDTFYCEACEGVPEPVSVLDPEGGAFMLEGIAYCPGCSTLFVKVGLTVAHLIVNAREEGES